MNRPFEHLPLDCTTCSYLPGGGRLIVRASISELPGRQVTGRVKLIAVFNKRPVDVAIKKKLHEIVQHARAKELPLHLKFEVELNLEIDAPTLPADWPWQPLAALNCVVADRALRGLWPQQHTVLLGQCEENADDPRLLPLAPVAQLAALAAIRDAADIGSVRLVLPAPTDAASSALHQAIRERHPNIDYWEASHLSGLSKHATATGPMASSTVFFPVVDGQPELLPLTVKLLAVQDAADAQIQITGLIGMADEVVQRQQHIRNLLTAIRAKDQPHPQKHWHTIINLPTLPFYGRSFELALVAADRIARGREFPMPDGKRLIATGSVSLFDAKAEFVNVGEVSLPLDSMAEKAALLVQAAQTGERVMVPANWRIHFAEWRERLATQRVSVVFVANVVPLD